MFRFEILGIQSRFAIVLLALPGVYAAGSPACAQRTSTVSLNSNTLRSLPPNFYGDNGQQRNGVPWDQSNSSNPGFKPTLHSLNLGILRFPAGTGGNYWDWSDWLVSNGNPSFSAGGDYDLDYSYTPSPYPSPLSELQKELATSSQTGSVSTQADFVMNVLSDPKCSDSGLGCALSPRSPDEIYQMRMLKAAAANSLNIPFVELGNEFYLPGQCNVDVYPNPNPQTNPNFLPPNAGTAYANLLANEQWFGDIRNLDPKAKVAAVAAYVDVNSADETKTPRWKTWNQGLFSGNALPDVDAVALHIYTLTGISASTSPAIPLGQPTPVEPNGKAAQAAAATMLGVPFATWNDVELNYLNGSPNDPTTNPQGLQSATLTPDVWITEYNLHDRGYAAFGTWAHGLYVATMSLKFLESPRVTMALHHETQGGAIYADILESSNAYVKPSASTPPNPKPPCSDGGSSGDTFPPATANMPTVVNGLSAVGLTETEINTAALGQTSAEELTFTDPVLISGTNYSSLYGWTFSGSPSGAQTIILNLSHDTQTLDISSVLSSGTIRQINGFTGAYVTGEAKSNAYTAYYVDSSGDAVEDDLPVTAGSLTPTALVLPGYSITRIKSGTD